MKRPATAHRFPLPHSIVAGASTSAVAAACFITRRLYDHRPRNHPTGLTSQHSVDVPLGEIAAALECSERSAARAVAALESAGAFRVRRRPGQPLRFGHRSDVADLAAQGTAWLPWTNMNMPANGWAAMFGLASWCGWAGRLNWRAIRRTGRNPLAVLCERAGMGAATWRATIRGLPVEGDLRSRTLRWWPDRLAAPRHEQETARVIHSRGRSYRPAATPDRFDASLYSGRTRGTGNFTDVPEQFRQQVFGKPFAVRAGEETRWRHRHRTRIRNQRAFQAMLRWCYTRPSGQTCGRNHSGPCGWEALLRHSQRRAEHAWQERHNQRMAALAGDVPPPR